MASTYPASWNVLFKKTPITPALGGQELPPPGTATRSTIDHPAGSTFPPRTRALPCDVSQETNYPVTLRDGTTIYTDVLVPTGNTDRLPAIVSWSPYGKELPGMVPPSVSEDRISGLAKFEGPDAAFWVCNGYALVNPDARGAFTSEGDLVAWGSINDGDGYDLIEWVADQPWSNGKVALAGNSWLAISQWGIASTRPPHLAAIAPWNGFDDFHRDLLFQGGMPDLAFGKMTGESTLRSNRRAEDPTGMMQSDPLRNPYWEDKRAKVENIDVPAYVVADGATTLHPSGTFDAWRRLGSEDKWLRVNNTNEWYDQYQPENEEDLLRCFDHYLKGADNGWKDTPRVRVSIADPNVSGSTDTTNTPFADYPVPDTDYQKLYLDAVDGSLDTSPPTESTATYDAKTGSTTFTVTFDRDTRLVGYPKAHLYVESPDADDLDLFVLVEKLDEDGTPLVPSELATAYFPSPPPGSPGRLRVSMRETDSDLSTDFDPVYTLDKPEKIKPGEVVAVDIAIRPISMQWHAGQQLRFTIAGHFIGDDPLPAQIESVNSGAHIIHTGGETGSYLQLPVVD